MHIHGFSGHPIVAPVPPPPPPEEKGKPSLFSELDPILGESQVDSDGKGKGGGQGTPERAAAPPSAAGEEGTSDPLPPPAPSVDLGIYTRTGNRRTPPPSVGGNCSTSV